MKTTRTMIVEVSCLVGFDALDEDDRTEDGLCAVDGSYGLTMTDVPADAAVSDLIGRALDHFHRTVPIACLDDFHILARPVTADDEAGSLMDIGQISFADHAEAGMAATSDLPEPSPYGTRDPFDPLPDGS